MYALQLVRRAEQESLLNFDEAERATGSRQVTIPLPHQGTEPGWPRVFHCDLNEEVELPLLAEPRLGAEQVGDSHRAFSSRSRLVFLVAVSLYPRSVRC